MPVNYSDPAVLGTRKRSARSASHVILGDRSNTPMSSAVVEYMDRYQPLDSYPAAVLHWAKSTTLASRPSSNRDARTLCLRLCKIATWLLPKGFSLADPIEHLLDEANIAAYLIRTPGTKGTLQTTASSYRRVRRALSTERRILATGTRTDVDSAVTPASDAQVESFANWVSGIDTQHLAYGDGLILITLIRGAGCTKADLDNVGAVRVTGRNRLTVEIGGDVPRDVVVAGRWAKPLLRVLPKGTDRTPFYADGRVRSGHRCLKNLENRYYTQRRNLGSDKARHLLPGFLDVNKYRAAWLVDRLQAGIRLDRLLREAGLNSAAALDRYLQFLPDSVAPRVAQ